MSDQRQSETMRCARCKHFDPDVRDVPWPGSGHCTRWARGYNENPAGMKPNDCWVESDEGWANIVGPEFGCVLFEAATPQPRTA